MEVVALLSQGRTAAAQCGLFTHKSVPVIFEPPCTLLYTQPHFRPVFLLLARRSFKFESTCKNQNLCTVVLLVVYKF